MEQILEGFSAQTKNRCTLEAKEDRLHTTPRQSGGQPAWVEGQAYAQSSVSSIH
jgi:hypothetical protein